MFSVLTKAHVLCPYMLRATLPAAFHSGWVVYAGPVAHGLTVTAQECPLTAGGSWRSQTRPSPLPVSRGCCFSALNKSVSSVASVLKSQNCSLSVLLLVFSWSRKARNGYLVEVHPVPWGGFWVLIRGEVLASRVDSHLTSSVAVAPFPDRSGVIFSLVFFFLLPAW